VIGTPGLPNFFIIGAAKSGTGSLYRYVGQHPHVFMSPVKEPRYWAFGDAPPTFVGPGDAGLIGVTRLADYRRLFAGAGAAAAVGEASVVYLYSARAAERIRQELPRARLIAILRQPAERAFSHFLMNLRDGDEPLTDFAQALAAEAERMRRGWHPNWFYRERGYYHRQLVRYYALFPAGQIRVFLSEDLRASPEQVTREIFRFLGVDDRFVPDTRLAHNVGGLRPSSRRLWRLSRTPPVRALSRVLPPDLRRRAGRLVRDRLLVEARLPLELRADLTAGYREDILRLQDLIRRDLSHWLG
jgi:hypothetical protein